MRKGISLVALVITIIVLVILAGTIILTVSRDGIIDKSKEAVFKTNVKTFLEDYINTKSKKQLEDIGGFNEATINASFADNNIKEWIPSITDDFIERLFISKGVFLADRSKYTEEEIIWLEQLGIGFGIAPVIGTTDEWELDSTKTKIVKYLGTIQEGVTEIIVPNRVKDSGGQIYTIEKFEPVSDNNLFNASPYSVTISDNLEFEDVMTNNQYAIKKLYIGDNVKVNSYLAGKRLEELYIGNNVQVLNGIMSSTSADNTLKKLIIGDNFYCTTQEAYILSYMHNIEEITIGDNFRNDSSANCLSHFYVKSPNFKKLEIGNNFYSDGKVLMYIYQLKELTIGHNFKCEYGGLNSISDVEKITIGDNATLSHSSIYGNTKLKTLNIGKGLSLIPVPNLSVTFLGFIPNPVLENINIGSFKNLGTNALKGCTLIKKVVLEDGGIISGPSAFENCTGIEEVVLGNVDMNAANVTNTFTGCTGIKRITIKNGAGENFKYKSGLFQNNTSIETVILEGNCTVPSNAFDGCAGLTNLTIGQNTLLNTNSFKNCTGLTSLYIPKTAIIQLSAFQACTNLTTVTFEQGITEISNGIFVGCTNLNNVTIPNSVISIADAAFLGSGLTSITIPGSVKTIGEQTFSVNLNLTNVTIKNGVETIGQKVFANCISLRNITIPSSVQTIGEYSFSNVPTTVSIRVANENIKQKVEAAIPSTHLGCITIDPTVDNL